MRWCKVAKVRKVKMCLGLDGASARAGGGQSVCEKKGKATEGSRGLLAVCSVKLGHCLEQQKG